MAAPFRSRFTALLALSALLSAVDVDAAHDASPAIREWATDSWVRAIAADHGIAYVGGQFTVIAPRTGGGAVVDLDRGDLAAPPPGVDGTVGAAVSDGGGGWFIGGDFRTVGGIPRRNLAHVDRDGRVSDWRADASGPVSSLLLASGRLFVGGSFSSVGSVERTGLAAVDPRSGAALPWDAHVEGQVLTLATRGRSLYLGGRFLAVGGESRAHLAAVDASNGSVLAWNPGASGEVYALAAAAGMVFAGGESMTIGGSPRTGLAAFDAHSGALLPWNPRLTSKSGPEVAPYVRSLAVGKQSLFFAGFFDSVNGLPIQEVAAVDVDTGVLRPWDPRPDGKVAAIAVRANVVYLVGDFRNFYCAPGSPNCPWFGELHRSFAAAVDTTEGRLLAWDPEATGSAYTVSLHGNSAFVGGTFQGIGGRSRLGLAAIDGATGRITDWNPTRDFFYNPEFHALAGGNGTIYMAIASEVWRTDAQGIGVGIGGSVYLRDGEASCLELQGNTLYFGGVFDWVWGDPRHSLAAVDATNLRVLPWDPAPYRDQRLPPSIDAIVAHGSSVYIGGIFTELGGASRSLLGEVDAVTGGSTAWVPASGNWGKALAVADDRVFAGMPSRVSALDSSTGAELWETAASGSVDALATADGLLFAAGTFNSIDGQSRRKLAALEPATGHVTSWNPDMDRIATELVVAGDQLFGVGNFGVYSVPLPGTTVARHASAHTNPARPASLARISPPVAGEARLVLSLAEPGPATIAVFDLQGRRIANLLNHAWLEAGTHEQSVRTSDWPRGLYFVRVDLAGHTESHRIAVIR